MAKKTKTNNSKSESDSTYILKIVLYIILGSLWLRFPSPLEFGGMALIGFPVGLIIGLLFVSYDHFQVDRKIEYVVLLISAIVSLFLPIGIIL